MDAALTPGDVAALVGAGLVAGFVNTLAGGGSLLTLPALMLTGLDASVANATNRVSILLQTGAAARGFGRAGRLPGRAAARLVLPTLAGAGLGAGLAAALPGRVMEPVVLGLLVVMAVILTVRPALLAPPAGTEPPRDPGLREMGWLVLAGAYGGFIQAGMGFMLLAILGGALRYDLLRANAIKAVLIAALTVLALAVFLGAGLVRWAPGLILGAASVAGALLGVRFAVRHAAALRWLVLAAVVASAVVLGVRRL